MNRPDAEPTPSSPSSSPAEQTSPTRSPAPPAPRLARVLVGSAALLIVLAIGLALGPSVHDWLDARAAASRDDSASSASDGADGSTWYISQMHPWIIQPEPGQCPICGMDLTPIDPARFAGEITIDPVVVQNIGVRITEADRGPIVTGLRAAGTVALAEERVHDVVPRFGGWVDAVMVDARFDRVRAGDPLFRVTSPEVLVAERDFALVRDGVGARDPALLSAARTKLLLLGLPEAEIDRLEQGGAATDTITVHSPIDGVVWRRGVRPGSELMPRAIAIQIVDLSEVWVETQVHERDLDRVAEGDRATIEVDALPGETLSATVVRIEPTIDGKTRSARARLVVANEDERLRPGMFATVTFVRESDAELVRVPREAVIGTGTRKVLFVSLGRGRFEPRTVTLGPFDREGRVAILDGLEAGEPVVVSGQFLLDSESRMREALAKVMRGDLAGDRAPASPATTRAVVELDDSTRTALARALDDYRALQEDLYRDDAAAARTTVDRARDSLRAFLDTANTADEHFAHRVSGVAELATTVTRLDGEALGEIRVSFGELSVPLREMLLAVGAPENPDGPWVGMRCGMADGIRDDGVWLQVGTDPRNPYFGNASGMRSCAVDTWGVPPLGEGGAATEDDHSGHDHSGHDHAVGEDSSTGAAPAFGPPLGTVDARTVEGILAIGDALHADDVATARDAAKALLPHLTGHVPGAASLEAPLRGIAEATTLDAARPPFGRIGVLLRDAARAGLVPGDDLVIQHCGMAPGVVEDGIWLQRGTSPRNPYFGTEHGMAECAIEAWYVTPDGLVEVDE